MFIVEYTVNRDGQDIEMGADGGFQVRQINKVRREFADLGAADDFALDYRLANPDETVFVYPA